MSTEPVIKRTKDGSTTLYSPRYDQCYHNPNGAVAESRHIFFNQSGILEDIRQNQPFNIFETGFGTGLNLILLLDYLSEVGYNSQITYFTVEAHPVDPGVVSGFDFGEELRPDSYKPLLTDIFGKIRNGLNRFEPANYLTFKLYFGLFDRLFDEEQIPETFDYLFHDPFSPEVNPELWTPGAFESLKEISSPDAVLSTYCAATSARASMAVAGWNVARTAGALGKREMTLASLNPSRLSKRKRLNEKRLIERFENGEF